MKVKSQSRNFQLMNSNSSSGSNRLFSKMLNYANFDSKADSRQLNDSKCMLL